MKEVKERTDSLSADKIIETKEIDEIENILFDLELRAKNNRGKGIEI